MKVFGQIIAVTAIACALGSAAVAKPKNAGPQNSNGVLHSAGHGNSAFGHLQGDPATRTTGSQNSAYGKMRAATAHAKNHPSPTGTP